MKTGINAVARKSGVSKSTVSRVLNRSGYVSREVEEKVRKAAREMNYFPTLTISRQTIALVTDSQGALFASQGFGAYLAGVLTKELNRAGYQVLFTEMKDLTNIHQNNTRAVVVLAHDGPGSLSPLQKMQIPVVLVNDKAKHFYSIRTDHAGGVKLAVKELCAAKHQKIGLLLGSNQGWAYEERYHGYKSAITESGLEFDPDMVRTIHELSVMEAVAVLTRRGITGLIACGESLGLQVTYALDMLGIKIPDGLSVISSEKPDVSRWLNPPHTTIDQNFTSFTGQLIRYVEGLIINKRKQPKELILETKLIKRESIKKAGKTKK